MVGREVLPEAVVGHAGCGGGCRGAGGVLELELEAAAVAVAVAQLPRHEPIEQS